MLQDTRKIPPFRELIRKISVLELRSKQQQHQKMKFEVSDSNADAFDQPIIPLVIESVDSTNKMDKNK